MEHTVRVTTAEKVIITSFNEAERIIKQDVKRGIKYATVESLDKPGLILCYAAEEDPTEPNEFHMAIATSMEEAKELLKEILDNLE